MADYQPITENAGNLIAMCPDCYSIMNQRVSLTKLASFQGKVEVAFPQAHLRVIESSDPTVNSDLHEEARI